MKRLLLLAAMLACIATPASAQQAGAKVVTACAGENIPLIPGTAALRVDKNGVLCIGNMLFDGTFWNPANGLLVGTAGAPAADVVTVQSPITAGSAGFPAASTPISGNAAGTTGAVVGTLAANSTKTTYICGFNVQAIGGTAAVGPITIAGLITASQIYQGSSSAAGGTVASATFNPCIPASATNTAITITTTANGTATAVNVNSWGFQQ